MHYFSLSINTSHLLYMLYEFYYNMSHSYCFFFNFLSLKSLVDTMASPIYPPTKRGSFLCSFVILHPPGSVIHALVNQKTIQFHITTYYNTIRIIQRIISINTKFCYFVKRSYWNKQKTIPIRKVFNFSKNIYICCTIRRNE